MEQTLGTAHYFDWRKPRKDPLVIGPAGLRPSFAPVELLGGDNEPLIRIDKGVSAPVLERRALAQIAQAMTAYRAAFLPAQVLRKAIAADAPAAQASTSYSDAVHRGLKSATRPLRHVG